MSTEPERNFHVVLFAQPVEAAAFVAAMSRFLNSPQAGSAGRSLDAVEVWHGSPERTDRVALYLSDDALRLANDAFPSVPVTLDHPVRRAAEQSHDHREGRPHGGDGHGRRAGSAGRAAAARAAGLCQLPHAARPLIRPR